MIIHPEMSLIIEHLFFSVFHRIRRNNFWVNYPFKTLLAAAVPLGLSSMVMCYICIKVKCNLFSNKQTALLFGATSRSEFTFLVIYLSASLICTNLHSAEDVEDILEMLLGSHRISCIQGQGKSMSRRTKAFLNVVIWITECHFVERGA